MQKNCSCNGLNEGCYKCQGTGYYDIPETSVLNIKRKPSETTEQEEDVRFVFNGVDYSGFPLPVREFYRQHHLKELDSKAREQVKSQKIHASNTKRGAKDVQLEEKLKRNNEVPKKIQVTEGLNIANSYKKTSVITCEDCGAKILYKNKYRHKKKCRCTIKNGKIKPIEKKNLKGQNNSPQQYQNSKRTHVNKLSSNPSIETFDSKRDYKEERKLDASRDYYKIKDHGRFGSHSVYDDMGDEALP